VVRSNDSSTAARIAEEGLSTVETNNKDENKRGRYLSPVMGAMDRGE